MSSIPCGLTGVHLLRVGLVPTKHFNLSLASLTHNKNIQAHQSSEEVCG